MEKRAIVATFLLTPSSHMDHLSLFALQHYFILFQWSLFICSLCVLSTSPLTPHPKHNLSTPIHHTPLEYDTIYGYSLSDTHQTRRFFYPNFALTDYHTHLTF